MKFPSLPLSLFAGVQWKLLGITAGALILIGSGTTTYAWFKGHKAGEVKIQTAWDLDAAKRDRAMNALLMKTRERDQQSATESVRIANDLSKTLDDAARAIADAHIASNKRLRQSEARARVYSGYAEAGPTERANLASHAAQLDKSLEEGRGLVEEFRITLGQRDREVVLLGQQIVSDRKAVSE